MAFKFQTIWWSDSFLPLNTNLVLYLDPHCSKQIVNFVAVQRSCTQEPFSQTRQNNRQSILVRRRFFNLDQKECSRRHFQFQGTRNVGGQTRSNPVRHSVDTSSNPENGRKKILSKNSRCVLRYSEILNSDARLERLESSSLLTYLDLLTAKGSCTGLWE